MKIEDYFVAQFHTVFFLQADKKITGLRSWEKQHKVLQFCWHFLGFLSFFVVSLLPTLKNQDMQWVERDVVSYFCTKRWNKLWRSISHFYASSICRDFSYNINHHFIEEISSETGIGWIYFNAPSELISTHYGRLCLFVLQFFRTDFPTEPLNFVKYFASFFRRNKTKIRCNYWENVKFSKVEQTKLGSNHWFSNTYLRLILMIAYAKIIAFVSVEIFTIFFFFSKIQQNVLSILWLYKKIAKKFKPSSAITFLCVQVILFEIDYTIFYANLHELFCQFISWTNWVNSGKFMGNCWISCQVMADMKKVYDDLIIINLYFMIFPFVVNSCSEFRKSKIQS